MDKQRTIPFSPPDYSQAEIDEVVSALGTVGLSRGLTPRLDTVGRIIIIASMFLGRIGPISMAVLFTKGDQPKSSIKHSEGTFYVG